MVQGIGQIGAYAKRNFAPTGKTLGQFNSARYGQRVGKHQGFDTWIGTIGRVMRQQPLAPYKRVARIVTRTVEQLAKIHIEVAQKIGRASCRERVCQYV